MRLVCISDTHHQHRHLALPAGDVLVCTGDITRRGAREDVEDFNAWLGTLPHRHKVVIAGNHDFCFERDPAASGWLTHATYLHDRGCVIDGVRFWGSPWTPRFFDWAFNLDRGAPIAEKWALIPADTDVLLTHGPPMGVLDRTARGLDVGCEALVEAVRRVRPAVHVFGHIHEAHGHTARDGVLYVNASTCPLFGRVLQAPIVVDLVGGAAVVVQG